MQHHHCLFYTKCDSEGQVKTYRHQASQQTNKQKQSNKYSKQKNKQMQQTNKQTNVAIKQGIKQMQQTTKQSNKCSRQINTTNKSSIIIVCAARGAIQRDECKHKQGLSFVGKTPSFVFFTQNTDNTHYFVFSSKNTDHTQNTDITQNTDNTLQSLESKLQSPYVYCHCLFQSSSV